MYQSLYRTWRPKTFSQMVGQQTIVRTLRNQAASGRIAHAYLFCGTRGTGKTSAARIMAMAINCQRPQNGDPCLECPSCLALSADTTLDLFEMDAASNSKVDEIREMLENVNYPPQFVKYKVYIIDEVHMLSNAAFNALLKTLEEPPQYMVFILATTEVQKIPATVLSRCQRFDFGRLDEEEIATRLRLALPEGTNAEDAALQFIAAAAEGSMRDAWSLMDMALGLQGDLTQAAVRQALGAVDRGMLYDFLDVLLVRDAARALAAIDTLMRQGRDVQVFLREFSSLVRRVIACKLDPAAVKHQDAEAQRCQAAAQAPLAVLTRLLEKCTAAEADARWASSPRALLEIFALEACLAQAQGDPLSLLVRIEQLEQRLAGAGIAAPVHAAAAAVTSSQPAASAANVAAGAPADRSASAPAKTSQPPTPDAGMSAAPGADSAGQPPQPGPAPAVTTDQEPQPAGEAVAAFAQPQPENPALSPKDAWNAMLKEIAKQLPSVYSMVNEGKFGGFGNDAFTLIFPADKEFFIGFLSRADKKEKIEEILSRLMGRAVSFSPQRELAKADPSRQERAQRDIDALSAAFGRDKIIIKQDGAPPAGKP